MPEQEITSAEGVWCIADQDHGETITIPFPSEVDALRALNGRGYGRVYFVPWGMTLAEAQAHA